MNRGTHSCWLEKDYHYFGERIVLTDALAVAYRVASIFSREAWISDSIHPSNIIECNSYEYSFLLFLKQINFTIVIKQQIHINDNKLFII